MDKKEIIEILDETIEKLFQLRQDLKITEHKVLNDLTQTQQRMFLDIVLSGKSTREAYDKVEPDPLAEKIKAWRGVGR